MNLGAARSLRGARRLPAGFVVTLVAALALVGCDDTPKPSASPTEAAAALRPGIQIDPSWTALDGRWTFTGQVDPRGDPTDVVLEVGPGPSNLRKFDAKLTVARGATTKGPLTITTSEIPNIPEICVRFSATNSAGSSSSTPVCFPHDPPSLPPPAAPTVRIDPTWFITNGQWTFTANVDPHVDPTSVVLELGRGPATAPVYLSKVIGPVDLTVPATLSMSTGSIPNASVVCVRFTVKNSLGSASSAAVCFAHDSPGPT